MMPTADTTVNCQKGMDVVAMAMLSCRQGAGGHTVVIGTAAGQQRACT